MNKHTLNYHTRLHDWYRQHSILQDKHQTSSETSTKTAHVVEAGLGTLTQDKLYFITDWCADVNKQLFKVKKKESPPLFRRCRMSASTSASVSKSADPRRIRSAEVFTLSGHWGKQPRPVLNGGELLPKEKSKTGKDKPGHESKDNKHTSGSRETLNDVAELCVRNSKDGEVDNKMLPRVNHDSLNLRANAFILKQNGGRPTERTVNSPRCSLTTGDKDPAHHHKQAEAFRRVKSAAPTSASVRHDIISGNYNNNKAGRSRSQKETERMKNAKNEEYIQKTRTPSLRSGVTSKTEDTAPETDDEGRLARPIIDIRVREEVRQLVPTFCNTCAGLYSGDTQHPATPMACGNCIHGISMTAEDGDSWDQTYQAQTQQEDAAKRLARLDKTIDREISRTAVEVKQVENRLTEDSIHYCSERETLRRGQQKPRFNLPNTFDDLEDERNISFDDDGGDDRGDIDENLSKSPRSDDANNNTRNSSEDLTKDVKNKTYRAGIIIHEELSKDEDNDECEEGLGRNTRSDSMDLPPDPNMLRAFDRRRGSRRLSINFSYKPTVGNISTSNSLLHVLSIDDCKVNMRYSPHKILEEHEVTENIMPPLSMINASSFSLDEAGEATSKVAMRISKGSSDVTSLQSSTANHATRANKKQYKILYDPDDLDFYKNKRPSSACLAKAFNTLIQDRTIMQRLDRAGPSYNAKSRRVVSTHHEGPTYRRINAALKKHMGEVLQDQATQLRNKYERQKEGLTRKKVNKGSSMTSHSPTISLSLESLPVVKKGILKNTENGKVHHGSYDSLPKSQEN